MVLSFKPNTDYMLSIPKILPLPTVNTLSNSLVPVVPPSRARKKEGDHREDKVATHYQ